MDDVQLFPGQDLEIEYFALSHDLSIKQVEDLVIEHGSDRVELLRAASRLPRTDN